jgi:inorganic triphosphatase YgiF
MQTLDDATLKTLTASFSTDFERQSWLLEHAGATIEVALDRGEIRAGSQRLAIDELELELKSGETGALWQLALQFAEQAPLRPANVSKAARGTALRKSHWQIPAPKLHPRARFDHAILLLDALQDTQDPHFLARARAVFEALAEDEALSESASEHALALAQALTETPWLTIGFGQHSLALQALLPPN